MELYIGLCPGSPTEMVLNNAALNKSVVVEEIMELTLLGAWKFTEDQASCAVGQIIAALNKLADRVWI